MEIHGIRFITWINLGCFKTLLSIMILVDHNDMNMYDKLVLSSNWGNQLSVIAQWYQHIKSKKDRVAFNGYIKILNWRVSLVCSCYSWPGVYNPIITQPSKVIIIFHVVIIEVVFSNLHSVISNRVITIGYILKYSIKERMRFWWPRESNLNY